MYICIYIYLYICLSIYLSIYISLSLSIYIYIMYISLCVYIYIYIHIKAVLEGSAWRLCLKALLEGSAWRLCLKALLEGSLACAKPHAQISRISFAGYTMTTYSHRAAHSRNTTYDRTRSEDKLNMCYQSSSTATTHNHTDANAWSQSYVRVNLLEIRIPSPVTQQHVLVSTILGVPTSSLKPIVRDARPESLSLWNCGKTGWVHASRPISIPLTRNMCDVTNTRFRFSTRNVGRAVGIFQEGIRNRTEPAEPNQTEPFDSGTGRNRTRKRTEPNRTEPRRVRKTQAKPRRTGEINFRTEPINFRKVQNRNKSNRTGSFLIFASAERRLCWARGQRTRS